MGEKISYMISNSSDYEALSKWLGHVERKSLIELLSRYGVDRKNSNLEVEMNPCQSEIQRDQTPSQ